MKYRILVADDQSDIRMLVRLLLEVDGRFDVVGEASTPDEAKAMVAELKPDGAVLDQSFGVDLTGLDIAPELKVLLPTIKIVLFSAHERAQFAIKLPGVDAFVVKTEADTISATFLGLFSAN